jgi:ectoine hydroxylase-related dioxygenase (phytanoyl-CoA dioxygenase family)
MLTVWLAITDATIDNGCLIVTRGSHKLDRTLHGPGKVSAAEIYIPESIVDQDQVTPLEVKAGGMVLLNKLTEHGSLDNNTDDIRWSFDLRYQPIGQPTGRSIFPGFVTRSAQHPELAVTDPAEWAQLWWDARDQIASGHDPMVFNNRWDANAGQAVCA